MLLEEPTQVGTAMSSSRNVELRAAEMRNDDLLVADIAFRVRGELGPKGEASSKGRGRIQRVSAFRLDGLRPSPRTVPRPQDRIQGPRTKYQRPTRARRRTRP